MTLAHEFAREMVPKILAYIKRMRGVRVKTHSYWMAAAPNEAVRARLADNLKYEQDSMKTFIECLVWCAFAAARDDHVSDNMEEELARRRAMMEEAMEGVYADKMKYEDDIGRQIAQGVVPEIFSFSWSDKYPIAQQWGLEAGFPDIGELRLEPDIKVDIDTEISDAIENVGGFSHYNYYAGLPDPDEPDVEPTPQEQALRTLAHDAVKHGQIDVLKKLLEEGLVLIEGFCAEAVYNDQFETLKWLRSVGCPWDTMTSEAAANDEKLHMLQWIVKNGCPIDEDAYCFAAEGDQKLTMAWLRQNCPQIRDFDEETESD